MEMDVKDKIQKELGNLKMEGSKWLAEIYRMPSRELKEKERNELSRKALQLPVEAQNSIIRLLEEAGVPHVYSIWQSAYEKLPEPSFRFIDWDSVEAKDPERYHVEIVQERGNHAPGKRQSILATGALAVGSIALVALTPVGKAIGAFWAIVVVVGVTVGGYLVLERLDSSKKKGETGFDSYSSNKTDGEAARGSVIRAARDENTSRLLKWYSELERYLLAEVEEKC